MDKSNLVFGNTALNKFVFKVVICVEILAVNIFRIRFLRRRQIAEHKLRSLNVRRVLPFFVNVIGAEIQLASALVCKQRIYTPRIEREFLSVARNFEHIVDMRINAACVNCVRSFCYLFG